MNPKCAYCGAEMRPKLEKKTIVADPGGNHSQYLFRGRYQCDGCAVYSPYGRWEYTEVGAGESAKAAALQRYVEPNRVLTLAELDATNGEPVFIQGGDGEEFWMIADQDWMFEIDYDPDFINMEHNDPAGHFGLHVLGWRALRRRPTDEERSAAKWGDAE